MIIDRIRRYLRNRERNKEWKRRNPNNGCYCQNEFDFDSVTIGDYTYGPLTVLKFGSESQLRIGSFCSIASGVVFNLAGDHPMHHVSTFPFVAKALNGPLNEAVSKGDIVVQDDVWIGQNAVIMSGITIGQGAVIAAGSVVTSDVPPYSIVGGVPAKIIKKRFSESTIQYLLTLDFKSLDNETIKQHLEELYADIDDLSKEELDAFFAWFPKR